MLCGSAPVPHAVMTVHNYSVKLIRWVGGGVFVIFFSNRYSSNVPVSPVDKYAVQIPMLEAIF